MKTSEFSYDLPPGSIAQTPLEPRHASRLLVMDRNSDSLEHDIFWNLEGYLSPGDILVINETRVIPARLFARKPTGGRVEILLLRRMTEHTWEALVGGKNLHAGVRLKVEGGPGCCITEDMEGSRRVVRFDEPLEPYLDVAGQMPLPPYIHTILQDRERYQTVFARLSGSVAAPTAGLHFTPELMTRLVARGVEFARLTLHVGLDTFAPVTEDDPLEHIIHTEWCQLTSESASRINAARQRGRRIVAVGTTSVRALETAASHACAGDAVGAFTGATDLFILPGYNFRAVDAVITNFHLPRSTLLMLVSAFAGRERILSVYAEAVQLGYRFYSFGDAMLIR